MTHSITKKFQSFTDVGLIRISESIKVYVYLILSSRASARSCIIGNTTSALTAQKAFLNNFEDIVNRRVDIRRTLNVIKTLFVMHLAKFIIVWEKIFTLLPSDINTNIRSGTAGHNNKILVSDEKFSLGKMIRLILWR